MKETKYKYKSNISYSLHDMRIGRISKKDNSIELHFENGYVELKEPYLQIDGTIEIENVDFDFCYVYILSRYGKCGGFRGKKIELEKFISLYKDFGFEVVDELYGYNQVLYVGYLSLPNEKELREIEIAIYFNGSIIYRTEQQI